MITEPPAPHSVVQSDRKPRLLFVMQQALGWITYSQELRRVLETRSDVEWEFLPMVPRNWRHRLLVNPFMAQGSGLLRRLDPITAYGGSLGVKVRRQIEAFHPDIVHCAGHFLAGAVPAGPGQPLLTAATDSTRWNMARQRGEERLEPHAGCSERDLFQRLDRIFTCSDWTAASVLQDYAVASTRVETLPLGVDPRPIGRAQPGQGNRLPQILMIGKDFERKGGPQLVSWVQGPLAGRCHLHIVSKSAPGRHLQGPDITLHGAVSHGELMGTLLPQMDLLCHPTQADMSSFVIIEAALAGVPALASNIGGIPELVREGETGWLHAPEDEAGFLARFEQLFAQPELLAQAGAAARLHALRNFDSRINYNRLIDRLVEMTRGNIS